MTYYLDTNICIYALNGTHPGIEDEMRTRRPSQIHIPSIVNAELQHGVRKSERPDETRKTVEAFLAPFEIIPFDQDGAHHYAEIRSHLEQIGEPIGPNDLIIAATVISRNGVLVTHNQNEFQRVPSLDLTDWV